MDRFQELKGKGWVNLSKQEKEEYQRLKGNPEQVASTPPKSDLISLTKQELLDLIDRKVAERTMPRNVAQGFQGEWQEEEPAKPRVHTAFLKVYQPTSEHVPRLLVGWRSYQTVRNDAGKILKQLYDIDLLTADGKIETDRIPLTVFSTILNREEVKLADVEKKRLVKKTGRVRRPMTDNEKYVHSVNFSDLGGFEGSKHLGDWVDLEETREEITVTIERASGQKHTMPAIYLNS